jgi:hypothetical protein
LALSLFILLIPRTVTDPPMVESVSSSSLWTGRVLRPILVQTFFARAATSSGPSLPPVTVLVTHRRQNAAPNTLYRKRRQEAKPTGRPWWYLPNSSVKTVQWRLLRNDKKELDSSSFFLSRDDSTIGRYQGRRRRRKDWRTVAVPAARSTRNKKSADARRQKRDQRKLVVAYKGSRGENASYPGPHNTSDDCE